MSLTILAIDDSATMRDMLRLALSGAGFNVHLAEDGIDALEKFPGMEPDVIITDINMPRMDGFGVIDAVRNGTERPTTPILVLTTESAQELKDRARRAGATGWIVKPFDREKLVAAIHRVASPGN